MNSPNLHRLQIFRIVYERLNISAAARKMGLSQPTVSRHLAVLEDELGFRLFRNAGGRIEPTWEAQRLYAETAGLFERVSQVEHGIEAIRRGARETLRIICSSALSMSVVPTALGALYRRMPELDMTLEGGGQRAQIEALRSNAADIAVGGRVRQPIELRQTVIGDFPLVAVVPRDHPLAAEEVFDLAFLAEYGSVMHNPQAPIGEFLFEELRRRGIAPKRYLSAFTLPFGVSLARHTHLCTVTDRFSANFLAGDDMLIKPLTEPLVLDLVTIEPAAAGQRGS
ncbi:LysR family transcriptional regulator, partial [Paracoccus sp. (in: a-proteobacteria)]|uniref:LysR family transcriptional regulator n=1 Tax=Paracoccus sp. TaxID=267 RepID=UPI003A838406